MAFTLRELGLLKRIRLALEIDPISVRVGQRGHPHPVSDEGRRGLNPARSDLAIDRQGVFTDEADRDALAQFSFGHVGMMPFLPEFLKHQRRASALEPAPAELAIVYPLFRHLEAEAVNVIADGLFDLRHSEKRHSLLDVRFGLRFEFHWLIS